MEMNKKLQQDQECVSSSLSPQICGLNQDDEVSDPPVGMETGLGNASLTPPAPLCALSPFGGETPRSRTRIPHLGFEPGGPSSRLVYLGLPEVVKTGGYLRSKVNQLYLQQPSASRRLVWRLRMDCFAQKRRKFEPDEARWLTRLAF